MALTKAGNPSHLLPLDAERVHGLPFDQPSRGRHCGRRARGPVAGVRELAARPVRDQVGTTSGDVICSDMTAPACGELQAPLSRTVAGDSTDEAGRR
jgi:hypothetical protein